ncbi:hypothetical protein Tco_1153707 [Tanacetum coccineum]
MLNLFPLAIGTIGKSSSFTQQLKESVDTLREIVEEAKVERPLDRSLAFACRYTKNMCLAPVQRSSINKIRSMHTPLGKSKLHVEVSHTVTSSSNTHKHVEPMHTQKSNVLVPPSTGVNSCTDASGSQLWSILKKHRIPPAKSDSLKKVEDHHKTIRSSLKTMNRVDSSIRSKRYYVEGLGHNLFSVGQFCDSDLEVAFRKHSCYVRDTDGVELLKVPWVKLDEYGDVLKNKARLVAKGFRQEEGLDFEESFASVARLEFKKKVYVTNLKAFLDPERTLMSMSAEALYGLKQAPLGVYDTLSSFFWHKDFSKGVVDPTLSCLLFLVIVVSWSSSGITAMSIIYMRAEYISMLVAMPIPMVVVSIIRLCCAYNASLCTVTLRGHSSAVTMFWHTPDTMADAEHAPAMAPPVRTDEQILPRMRGVPIGNIGQLHLNEVNLNPVQFSRCCGYSKANKFSLDLKDQEPSATDPLGVVNRAHIDYAERMWEEFTQLSIISQKTRGIWHSKLKEDEADYHSDPKFRFTKLINYLLATSITSSAQT